ncbi:TMEM175 family protein [Streptomyces sp. NPDC058401]|uniref:TMEM175 family protein n=1 Tax=Streptomyces sp. NPDC058401 TaxID=3346480 RepID=UPI00365F7BD9
MVSAGVEIVGEQDRPGRLAALSDGVYAIAITLLVLNIAVPAGLDPAGFRSALHGTLPQLGAYVLSFTIIAIFWDDQRRVLDLLLRTDPVLTRIALAGLGLVALLPFPTSLLARYPHEPLAVAFYSANLAAVDLAQLALLLLVWKRPHLTIVPAGRAVPDAVWSMAATIVVFLLAVPLAFLSTTAAEWFWLALVPAQLTVRIRRRWRRTRQT